MINAEIPNNNWYPGYFHISFDLQIGENYNIYDIEIEKRFDVPDIRFEFREHTEKEFADYWHLMDEMYAVLHEEIAKNLQSNISDTIAFLEYHLLKYFEKKGDEKPFLLFIREILPSFPEISEIRKTTILDWVEEKRSWINNGKPLPAGEITISGKSDNRYKHPWICRPN